MQTSPQLVIFDLDGTLTDSAQGIVSSFRHALGGYQSLVGTHVFEHSIPDGVAALLERTQHGCRPGEPGRVGGEAREPTEDRARNRLRARRQRALGVLGRAAGVRTPSPSMPTTTRAPSGSPSCTSTYWPSDTPTLPRTASGCPLSFRMKTSADRPSPPVAPASPESARGPPRPLDPSPPRRTPEKPPAPGAGAEVRVLELRRRPARLRPGAPGRHHL